MNSENKTAWTKVGHVLRAHAARIVVSLIIAGAFVWLFRRGGLPLVPDKQAFANVQPWALPVYVVLLAAATYLRTQRWVYLLRPIAPTISERRVVGIGLVGVASILFAPLRMGEAVRPYLLARDGKVTFFQALGAAGAERVVDGFVMTLVTAISLLLSTALSPLQNRVGDITVPVKVVPGAVFTALAVFGGALLAMTVFYVSRDIARRLVARFLGVVSPRLADFVTGKLELLADGLRFLSSTENRLRFVIHTLLYWACAFLSMWLLVRGCGVDATPAQAFVALGVLGLGAVVPAGPGFFGAYQIAIFTGLALFFEQSVVVGSGAAVVFLSYASQLGVNAAAGLIGYVLIRSRAGAPVTTPEAS